MTSQPEPTARDRISEFLSALAAEPPHTRAEQPRKRILIDAPDESTILAARHLDATEGRVQVDTIVDAGTRSAITCVLDYIATAHNADPVERGHEAELTRLRGELRRYTEAESADAAAGAYAGRAETAEAERDQARRDAADAYGQRDRLRQRIISLAERWQLPGHISMPDAAAEIAEVLDREKWVPAPDPITRVREALASFDGRGVLTPDCSSFDVPTVGEVLDKVRAALDGPTHADTGPAAEDLSDYYAPDPPIGCLTATTAETAPDIPPEIKAIVDQAAGKDHSATGAVMRCLAEVLAVHRQMITTAPGWGDESDDTDLTEDDIDAAMATATPVQLVEPPALSVRRRLRRATVDAHVWDGTHPQDGAPAPAVTAWLADSPHHWAGDQLVIHADNHNVWPQPGWTLARWKDGKVSVLSPDSAHRFLEPDDTPDGGEDTALAAALRRSEADRRDLTATLSRIRSIPRTPPLVDPDSVQGRFYTNGWQTALDRVRTELVDLPDDTDLTESDIDRMMAAAVPVQIVTAPPGTFTVAPNAPSLEFHVREPDEDPAAAKAAFDASEKGVTFPDAASVCPHPPHPDFTCAEVDQTRPYWNARWKADYQGHLAESGIHTPGCNCDHDGMGVSWHGDDCPWRRAVLDGNAAVLNPKDQDQ